MKEKEILNDIISNIEKVVVGKRNVIEKIMVCLISGGHVLIEDVPGIGKTMLVQALAKSINCEFKRIQFTPDLLPSDITGVSVYNQKTGDFEFKKGPIMGNIILADEINRTSPKTQASLLEAMEEQQVTADGTTYKLMDPFMVLATQNPIEYEGTFPLPEAQLDRFMMKISVGYPEDIHEIEILRRHKLDDPINNIDSVANPKDIVDIYKQVRNIDVSEEIERYIISIVTTSRNMDEVALGGSPRASLCLYRASQGRAYLKGRSFVTPDDVKFCAKPILSHRLILKSEFRLRGTTPTEIVEKILSKIPVPGVDRYA